LAAAAEAWRVNGWTLVPGLVPRSEIDSARAAIGHLPPPTGDPTRRSSRPPVEADHDGAAFRETQFGRISLFPFHDAPALNDLVVHPAVVGFVSMAMGSIDLRIYQSRLWSKYAGEANFEQPLHRDLNHSLVPTRSDSGWWHAECFLYLNDVEEDTGAPRLVPRPEVSAIGEPSSPFPVDPHDAPSLYEAEVAAAGPAGSLLVYRSDVWHRGVDLTRPGAERHVLVLAFKHAGQDWIGFDTYPPLALNADFVSFANGRTPEELALFGIPLPGHPFWTRATVDAMAHIYRHLDLDPWRAAL